MSHLETIIVKKMDLDTLHSLFDLLHIVGRELRYKEPAFSQRIRSHSADGQILLQKMKEC